MTQKKSKNSLKKNGNVKALLNTGTSGDTSKEGPKPKKKKGPARAEIEHWIVEWLFSGTARTHYLDTAPPFPTRFLVVRPKPGGNSTLFAVKCAVAEPVGKTAAAGILYNYLMALPESYKDYKLSFRACLDAISALMSMPAHTDEMPKLVGFRSEKGLVQTRLGYDPVATEPSELSEKAPNFNSLVSHMENKEAFMMRVGSFFDERADRKQALWIYGPTNCGKSQLGWLIEAMTQNTINLTKKGLRDDRLTANLVSKRVAMVQEAPASFIRSDEFKNLTGDDYHHCNPKYQMPFDVKIATLFICFSNESPEIPHDTALMHRVIACRMRPVAAKERLPKYLLQERLLEEIPYIVGACIKLYESLEPGADLPHDDSDLINAIDLYESEQDDLIHHNFVLSEGECCTRREMQQILEKEGIFGGKAQGAVVDVLMRRYGVTRAQRRCRTHAGGPGQRVWFYFGLRPRRLDEKAFLYDADDVADFGRQPRLMEILPDEDDGPPH